MKTLLICFLLITSMNNHAQLVNGNPHNNDLYVQYSNGEKGWEFLKPVVQPYFELSNLVFQAVDEKIENIKTLVIKNQNKILFHGQVYDISRAGLYRFLDSDKFYKNLISVNDTTDPIVLVQALASLTMHGNRHDNYVFGGQFETVDSLLQTVPALSITCGANRNLIIYYLKTILGYYQTRTVNSVTTYKMNNYDNGHSLFEMQDIKSKQWMLVDGDLNLRFQDERGNWLSAEGFLKRVLSGSKPIMAKLTFKNYSIDPEFKAPGGFNYTSLMLAKFSSEEMIWQWYSRVFRSYN